jgi:hypothetical protein
MKATLLISTEKERVVVEATDQRNLFTSCLETIMINANKWAGKAITILDENGSFIAYIKNINNFIIPLDRHAKKE